MPISISGTASPATASSDQNVTSLHWSLGATYQRVRDNGDDTVTYISSELSYHLDTETGDFLDAYVNPYTGETVKPRYLRVGPSGYKTNASGGVSRRRKISMKLPYTIKQSIVRFGDRQFSVVELGAQSGLGRDRSSGCHYLSGQPRRHAKRGAAFSACLLHNFGYFQLACLDEYGRHQRRIPRPRRRGKKWTALKIIPGSSSISLRQTTPRFSLTRKTGKGIRSSEDT